MRGTGCREVFLKQNKKGQGVQIREFMIGWGRAEVVARGSGRVWVGGGGGGGGGVGFNKGG